MTCKTIAIKEYDDILERLASEGKFDGNIYDFVMDDPNDDEWITLNAYLLSKTMSNSRLDFSETIYDEADIENIAENCRRLGIKEFTISVRQENLLDMVLPAFQKLGVVIQGITEVATPKYTISGCNQHKIVNALLMKVL